MNKEQLQQAMSLLGFEVDSYSIDEDYESIEMVQPEQPEPTEGEEQEELPLVEKPTEEALQAALDEYLYQQALIERLEALGDVVLAIGKYLEGKEVTENDSFNLAGFSYDKFDTDFGWHFENISKPTIDELEAANVEVANDSLSKARDVKLKDLRYIRDAKLKIFDNLVNTAFLNSWTAGEKTVLRNYRLALLDITEPFKADASLLDELVVAEIEWPEEPSEA